MPGKAMGPVITAMLLVVWPIRFNCLGGVRNGSCEDLITRVGNECKDSDR